MTYKGEDMKNLKKMMMTVNKITYTQKDLDDAIAESIYTIGYTKTLIVAIEELGELINVISDNTENKLDYIHTVEELTDVIITLEYCKQAAHMKPDELAKTYKIPENRHKIMYYINVLSRTQQSITKFIRHATRSRQSLIQSVIITYAVIDDIISFYNIDKRDIEKMKQLKINRLRDRLDNRQLFQ